LNYLHEQVNRGEGFQYILTLNHEKIEAEERSRQIRLDVIAARRVILTKAMPFLGFRYQEPFVAEDATRVLHALRVLALLSRGQRAEPLLRGGLTPDCCGPSTFCAT